MGEEIPALRPVTMAMAQTVALCALGIPPSPHIRSSWNLPSKTKLMMVFNTCANEPAEERCRQDLIG